MRTGTFTVNGTVVTVQQQGDPTICEYSLRNVPVVVDGGGNLGYIYVDTQEGCVWTAQIPGPWTNPSILSGTGNGQIVLNVPANPDVTPRSVNATVAGIPTVITQQGRVVRVVSPRQTVTIPAAGGEAVFQANVDPEGWAWSLPQLTLSWTTLVGSHERVGSGPVKLVVSPNRRNEDRRGYPFLGLYVFELYQPSGNYTYQLSKSDFSIPHDGGEFSLLVTVTPGDGEWDLPPYSYDGVTVLSPGLKSGSGQVNFQVTANPYGIPRHAQFQVAGKPVRITQAGKPSEAYISPVSFAVGAQGEQIRVDVTTSLPITQWSAVSLVPWVRFVSYHNCCPASITGPGHAVFEVLPNTTTSSRAGQLRVGGKEVTVTQEGQTPHPAITLDTKRISIGLPGGDRTITLTSTDAAAPWSATSFQDWIQVISGAQGVGSGLVQLRIEENPLTVAREGNLLVAGNLVTVEQATQPPEFTFEPSAMNVPKEGGLFSVTLRAIPKRAEWAIRPIGNHLSGFNISSAGGGMVLALRVYPNSSSLSREIVYTLHDAATFAVRATFVVRQAGDGETPPFTLSRVLFMLDGKESTQRVTINANDQSAQWSAVSDSIDWLQIISPPQGVGSGFVEFRVRANTTGSTRFGKLRVAGLDISVQQDAQVQSGSPIEANPSSITVSVDKSLSPRAQAAIEVRSDSGGTISASVPGAPKWVSVTPKSSELPAVLSISLDGGGLEPGTYSTSLTVSRLNPISTDISIPIILNVLNQGIRLSMSALQLNHEGQAVSLGVFASSNSTSWNALSRSSWIRIVNGLAGSGNGTVQLAVDPNTGASRRTGEVQVSGQAFAITQLGKPMTAPLQVSPATLSFLYRRGEPVPGMQSIRIDTGSISRSSYVRPLDSVLAISPGQAPTPAVFRVELSRDALNAMPPGRYASYLRAAAESEEITIPVSIVVEAEATSIEKLRLTTSPTSLAFTHNLGAAAPEPVRIRVTNSPGNLIATTSGEAWLKVFTSAWNQTTSFEVSAIPSALPPGDYAGVIRIRCETDLCDAAEVPVGLKVRNPALEEDGPQIYSGGIVHGGSFEQAAAGGAWISIFGRNLSATTRGWRTQDFAGDRMPIALDGVRVTIDGRPVAISFVSPTQINVQVPKATAKLWARVEVFREDGKSTAASVYIDEAAPGFFVFRANQKNYVAALHPNAMAVGHEGMLGTQAGSLPAKPLEVISLYGTGFGETNPPVVPGQLYSGAAPLEHLDRLRVLVGGVPAKVEFAGISAAGLYQFNIVVPILPPGEHLIRAEYLGQASQDNLFLVVGLP